jgi:single-strand DNA-binding protein
MSSFAGCDIIGRLTRDSELKFTSGGQACAHFSIATDDRKKKGDQWIEEPSFWDITLWGKQAESVNQYLTKGKLVHVSGKMTIDRWEQDGQKREKLKVIADTLTLLGGGEPKALDGKQETPRTGKAEPHEPLASTGRPVYQKAQPVDDFDEDLPF